MNVEPRDPTRTPEPERKGDDQGRQRFGWRNVAVLAGLLLVNYLVVSMLFSTASNPRVEIPYRPTFMAQLRDGNVATITAKGLGIEGTFAKAVRYPDAEATATTKFSTEVPEFADQAELDQLVQEQGVRVTAEPSVRETRLWLTFLMYFGPTLLLFGAWYWYMRKASAGAAGMFSFGRSRAKQYEPTTERA
jgi:cell division protease FtsH